MNRSQIRNDNSILEMPMLIQSETGRFQTTIAMLDITIFIYFIAREDSKSKAEGPIVIQGDRRHLHCTRTEDPTSNWLAILWLTDLIITTRLQL